MFLIASYSNIESKVCYIAIKCKKKIKKVIKAFVPYRIYSPVLRALRWIVSLKYVGDKFECPFCEGHFSTFFPSDSSSPVNKEKHVVGAGYRLNARCPRCNSDERERLIYSSFVILQS